MINFPKTKDMTSTSKRLRRQCSVLGLLAGALLLSSCYGADFEKHKTPIPSALISKMTDIGVDRRDGIFVRIFKKEAELEVWKKKSDGKSVLLKVYEICSWSGELGPKFKEGDRQSPEGFYSVSPAQMNPNSSFHLSFNIGYPNSFDKSRERTGSFLMVHGACSSAGCYSMEDTQIEEIYSLAREAFLGGQDYFRVHAFPFRMTPENMALFRDSKHMRFWRTLKRGYEHFELTGVDPNVEVCNGRYVFNPTLTNGGAFKADEACPAYEVPETLAQAVKVKIEKDRALEDGIAASWETPEQRRHAELVARLKIENERIDKFKDRGLAYSSHLKRRLIGIEEDLIELGYNADGSLPEPVVIPQPVERPVSNATAFVGSSERKPILKAAAGLLKKARLYTRPKQLN